MDQLRLFGLTQNEVEIKTHQLVTCQSEIQALSLELKTAQDALRMSTEAGAVADIRSQIKAAKETMGAILVDLTNARIALPEAFAPIIESVANGTVTLKHVDGTTQQIPTKEYAPEAITDEDKLQILRVLDREGQPLPEIDDRVAMPRNRAQSVLASLVREGLASVTTDGRKAPVYSITAEGEELADA